MTQDEIIRMAREAGFSIKTINSIDGDEVFWFTNITDMLKDFASLVAAHDREKQAEQEPVAWIMEYDGKTHVTMNEPKLLTQSWNVTPLYAAPVSIEAAVLAEREACAKVCDEYNDNNYANYADSCAAAIRARGEK